MPEIGRDDREYWLKMLMGLSVEAHHIGEELYEEQQLCDPDGTVRAAKKNIYLFECECIARNAQLIESAAMSERQRKVMKWRYIKQKRWADIFRYLNTTLRYTYKIHARALRRVDEKNRSRDFKEEYRREKARLDEFNPYSKEYEKEEPAQP